MPRSNRPRRSRSGSRRSASERSARAGSPEPLDVGRALGGGQRLERHADGDWWVRPVAGPAAGKTYRCPGCDHEVLPGVPHVVAWPADGVLGDASALGDRRHWHRPCWAARDRRAPGVRRAGRT